MKIGGKTEKIYVPFAMLTGLMLDNDVFSNVSVTNGKIINDGDRTIVAGFALPGLQENLNLSKDKFEIPDYIEVTADGKNREENAAFALVLHDENGNMQESSIPAKGEAVLELI